MKKLYISPEIDTLSMESEDLLVVLSGETVDDVVAGAREDSYTAIEDDAEWVNDNRVDNKGEHVKMLPLPLPI